MGQVKLLNVSNIMAENVQAVGAIFYVIEHDIDSDSVLDGDAIIKVDDGLEAPVMAHVHWDSFAASPNTIFEDHSLLVRENCYYLGAHLGEWHPCTDPLARWVRKDRF
jgi:hypothetical protein